MAISVVQSQIGAANASSVTATFGAGATAGNTIVAFTYTNSGTGNPVISGFTRQINLPYSGTAQSINFYTKIATGGETAIQMTGGNTISRIHIAEISGLLGTITTDGSNTNTASSVTSLSTNSITTANTNDIVFVCAGTSTGEAGSQSWDSSFSTLKQDSTSFRLFSGYQIVSSTSTYSSTGTIGTTSTNSGAFIIGLQASSGSLLSTTQTSTARIANAITKTQPSIARVSKNITKTQTSIARIQNLLTKTQSAVSRVANNRTITQSATAHITNSPTKIQTSIARIQRNLTVTQTAVGRIAVTVTKTQPAIANITNGSTATFGDATDGTGTSTSTSASKIANSSTPSSSGTAQSLTAHVFVTTTAVMRGVIYADSSGAPGSLLAQTDSQTISNTTDTAITFNFTGANQISITSGTPYWIGVYWQTPSSAGTLSWRRGSTLNAADKSSDNSSGPASTFGTPSTINGPLALFVTYSTSGSPVTKTQSAVARIANNITKTQSATSRIANNLTHTQAAVARIAVNLTKTQSSIARIATALTKTQSSTARVAVNLTVTQSATAHIVQASSLSKNQSSIARVANNITKTQSSVARIQRGLTKTQPSTARIATNLTKTQSAVARISNSFTKNQTSVARIARVLTKTQSATSRIANVVNKTQTATARITQLYTKTQTAIARVAIVGTKTQTSTARIQGTVTKTQSVIARIANSETKTQTSIAHIANVFTKTQTAVSRIANKLSKTQNSTARLATIIDSTTDFEGLGYAGSQRKVAHNSSGRIFTAYRKHDGLNTYQPWVSYSDNGGTTWTTVQVASISTDHQRVPSIFVGHDDTVHYVWYGKDPSNTGTDQRQIKYSKSTDNGATWSSWVSVGGDVSGYTSSTLWQEHPNIIEDPTNLGTLYVVWEGRDSVNTASQAVKFSKSTDNGATWSAWTNIGPKGSRPDIAVTSDGTIHVAFYSSQGTASSVQQIQHATSTNGGTSWSSADIIGNTIYDSRMPSIIADGTSLHVVWRAPDATYSTPQIQYAKYSSGSWSSTLAISPHISIYQFFPQIALVSNTIPTVVWFETSNSSGYASEAPTTGNLEVSQLVSGSWSSAVAMTAGGTDLYANIDRLYKRIMFSTNAVSPYTIEFLNFQATVALSKTQTSIARIAKTVTKTQTSVARISRVLTKTQTSTARIVFNFTKTQSATAHIVQNAAIVVNAETTADSGAGTSSSIVLSAPSIIHTGDILLATINLVGASAITVTPPTGFTLRVNNANSTLYSTLVYTKVATGSEPGSYTFGLSSASSFASTMSSWSGVANVFPSIGGSFTNTNTSGTTTGTVSQVAGTYPAQALRIVSGYGGASALSITNGGSGNTILVNSANSGGTLINNAVIVDVTTPSRYSAITWGSCTFNSTTSNNTETILFLRPDQTVYTTPHTDFTSVIGFTASSTSVVNTTATAVGEPQVIAFAIGDPTTTVSSVVSSSGMTFTRIAQAQDASNLTRMEVWYAITNSQTPQITATYSGSTNVDIEWWTFSGASGTLGHVVSSSGNSSAISLSLTTTQDNAQVFFPMTTSFSGTATISNTLESYFTIPGDPSKTILVGKESAVTTTAGTTVTQTTTAPSTTDWSAVGFEVLPRVVVNSKTQTATARIERRLTKTQSSIARIARVLSKPQTATARIANKFIKTQTATARVFPSPVYVSLTESISSFDNHAKADSQTNIAGVSTGDTIVTVQSPTNSGQLNR